MQRLCVTVTAPTMAELRRKRDAVADADLIELRLDGVRDPDVDGALADRRRPVIVTCRPTWEGGSFAGSEEERKRLLARAIDAGADYVDLEARAGFEDLLARSRRTRVVLSIHDFDGIPDDLAGRIRSLRATGADVVKVAVKTERLTDCVSLLDAAAQSRDDPGHCGLVLIGMGEHGTVTRVLPSRFGSSWTYAGGLADLGQLTPGALVDEFRFRDLGPDTSVYAITGAPVAHSVSPAMHNAAFQASGLDAVYLPLPAVDVDDFVAFARAFGLKGANVTIPYKVKIFDRVDEASELAARIGAINAIRIDGSRWVGDNTDAAGFLEPLVGRVPLAATRAALVGAGGAARGVAIALANQGAHVAIHARDRSRAADVAALVSGRVGEWPPPRGTWDLLVNCTPVGMHPHVDETPVAAACLGPGTVYDLVYNPPRTRLLHEAAQRGCETIGGLDMLVGQARQAFAWWTGVRPSADVMRAAAERKLAEFNAYENHVV